MKRDFLSLSDLGSDGLTALLDFSSYWKRVRQLPGNARPLIGRSVALVFEKASTRTRLSLEVAVAELGGHPVVISAAGSQLGRGEPVADTAHVLSRMTHAVAVRTFAHQRLLEFAQHCTVPVLNALTDAAHPMQLLADLMTVREHRGRIGALKYAWIGDGNNMANSWIEAAGLLGLDLVLACPEGYDPAAASLEEAKKRGARVKLVRDPEEAARHADVISTDVFTSMGQESETKKRLEAFRHMQVNQHLVGLANKEVIVLHCLPAHRGEEIEGAVIDGPHSAVFDQAENRLHTAKAALVWALGLEH